MTNRTILKKVAKILGIVLVLLLVLVFSLRNVLLHYAIEQVAEKIHKKNGALLHVGASKFSGISTLEFDTLELKSPQGDSLLMIQHFSCEARFLPLLLGKLRLESLEIIVLNLLLEKNQKGDNFSFLLKKSEPDTVREEKKDQESIHYGYLLNQFLNTVFDVIPAHVRLEQINIQAQNDTFFLKASLPLLELNNGAFSGKINIIENSGNGSWTANGNIDKKESTARLSIVTGKEGKKQHPILENKYRLVAGFDSLNLALTESDFDNNQLSLSCLVHCTNFKAGHWRLSPEEVVVPKASLNCKILVGDHSIQILDGSLATVNDIQFNPKFLYQVLPYKAMGLDLTIPEMNSQVFFNALPKGLFKNLERIQSRGNLQYDLHFFIDTRTPDSLEFSSTLKKNKFQITGFGNSNLLKLNDEFSYTAYERGVAVKTFLVGPSNPAFCPLTEISPYLVNAVMTSEDGNFFFHNGFNEEAFRKSIAENYKKGRFARGGSTISMQLVKNVFLTRNKTISRKLEEAMIVWMIESNRLVSKERMLEVYFNIIEWGPGIYGITEASQYYFKKKPSELNLEESIYLAMIVPRPKGFKYYFDAEGKIKEPYFGYFRLISGMLEKKGIIQEGEKIESPTTLELKGQAKELVIKPDTLATDSLPLLEELFE